jgi:hypothetical protein
MSLILFFTVRHPRHKRESCEHSSLKSRALRASNCLTLSSCLRIHSVPISLAMIYRLSRLAPTPRMRGCQVLLSSPMFFRHQWGVSMSDGREACRAVTQNPPILLSQTTAFGRGLPQCARVCFTRTCNCLLPSQRCEHDSTRVRGGSAAQHKIIHKSGEI